MRFPKRIPFFCGKTYNRNPKLRRQLVQDSELNIRHTVQAYTGNPDLLY